MPDYAAPGVYIEEQPAPQSIQGLSTSIAGFVGATQKGPTEGLPVLVTSFKDFVTKFGGYLKEDDKWKDQRFLAYAVEGFFNNGGQIAYIKRVASASALPSSVMLQNRFVTRLARDTAVKDSDRNTAHLVSQRGINVGTKLIFSEVIKGIERHPTASVVSCGPNFVTLDTPLPFRFTAAGCSVFFADLSVDPQPEPGDNSLEIKASTPGKAGQAVRVNISDHIGAVGVTTAMGPIIQTELVSPQLEFDPTGVGPAKDSTSVKLTAEAYALVQVGDEIVFVKGQTKLTRAIIDITDATEKVIKWTQPLGEDFTAGATAHRPVALRPGKGKVTDVVYVKDASSLAPTDLLYVADSAVSQFVKITAIDPAKKELTLDTAAYPVTATFQAAAMASQARGGETKTLLMRSVNNFYEHAVIEIDDGAVKQYQRVKEVNPTQRTLEVASNLNGVVPAGAMVRVIEFSLSVNDGQSSERFDGLSMATDAVNFVEAVVNNQSQLVRVSSQNSVRAIPFHLPATPLGVSVALAGGDDGSAPSADDYIGQDKGPGQRTGIKALADIDAISIIAAPGMSDQSVQNELIVQCEMLKDRFAVLDVAVGSPLDQTPNGLLGQRSNYDSRYAAMYAPWLRIRDPLYPTQRGGKLIPPSGHVIGIYARVDATRGVHKAPANEPVQGITGLEVNINEREHGILNLANVNVIRDFRNDNRGIRVYGARCVTSDNANKYVPVRRLLIFIEESLQQGLQFVVFEPNAEPLWQQAKRTIRGFLNTVWRAGGLEGLVEEDAYRVYCNINQTMTEDDVANGRLIIEVWVAPVRPAEFVIVRINRLTREAQE